MSNLTRLLETKVGCGYVWSTRGEVLTQELLTELIATFGAEHYVLANGVNAAKWLGKQCFDCSGLIVWGLRQLGCIPQNADGNTDAIYANWCTPIADYQLQIGDIVFRGSVGNLTHVGVYKGNGQTIEAKGTAYGVVIGDSSSYNVFARLTVGDGTLPATATTTQSAKSTTNYSAGSWQALAKSMSQRTGCDLDILLATVEAETGGNNDSGDQGRALGYGQVWYQWHSNNFQQAATLLGITLPTAYKDISDLTLKNNEFSMAVAAYCIKEFWSSAGKDWDRFTRAYVGSGIPDEDFNRRKKIWEKYKGTDGSSLPSIGSTVNSNPNNMPTIDPTNYTVTGPSRKTGDILYGRKYRIFVTFNGDSALDVSHLRCTFRINKTMLMQPNMSEITIYNLNAQTENAIIREGAQIIIEAGYEGGVYGQIYVGEVVQPIRDKEDGVTYKLTLTSLDGDRFINYGFVNFSLTKGFTSRQNMLYLVNQAKNPAQLGNISETLSNSQLTRGKACFGLSRDYLRQIARGEQASFYVEDGKVNIVRMTDLPQGEILDLSPQTGLLDVPVQTDFGMSGKCLMNPGIKCNTLIHIDNSIIRDFRRAQNQIIRQLDQDGIYRVVSCDYVGDTRGDDWHVEFETITQAGYLPGMVTNGYANPQ